MSTHIDGENGNKNVSNNGSSMSLRELVDRNEKAMHGMSSRFGDVNVLKGMLEELLRVLATQKEVLGQEVKVLSDNDVVIKAFVDDWFSKVKRGIIATQGRVGEVGVLVSTEIEERKKLAAEVQELKRLVNQRSKRRKYGWIAIGVFLLSLVICLGYICYTLNDLNHNAYKNKAAVMNGLELLEKEVSKQNSVIKVEMEKLRVKGRLNR